MTPKENPLEQYRDALVDRILADVDAYEEAPRPFEAVELSQAEQLERYGQIRDNPQAWAQLIQEQGLESTLRYSNMMEPRWQKARGEGGQNASSDSEQESD